MIELYGYRFPNVYIEKKGRFPIFFTKSISPGKRVYGENLIRFGSEELREWEPKRSKLGAALVKGISQIGMKEGDRVLYLGAASGTTVSHVSDIVGKDGFIFALDFAPRVVRDLVFVCEDRKNITPLLADANQPLTYSHLITQVDCIFMDIAQRNQVEIFLKNCELYLKSGGFGLLSLKSRSVDVTKRPADIFRIVRAELEKHMIVSDYRDLYPYEKDHAFFVCKKK